MTTPHPDPVVRSARRNLLPVIAYVLLAAATAISIALAVDTRSDVGKVESRACRDVRPGPGVMPSEGCKEFFDAITNLCAQNPGYCARSERRAARRAQEAATNREVGPRAAADGADRGGGGGGGGSPGSNPRSPDAPSRTPPRDGGGGGGEPTTPAPDDGPAPSTPTPDQPDPEPEPEPPAGDNPPPITVPDVREIIEDVVPGLCTIPGPLGPIVRLCP